MSCDSVGHTCRLRSSADPGKRHNSTYATPLHPRPPSSSIAHTGTHARASRVPPLPQAPTCTEKTREGRGTRARQWLGPGARQSAASCASCSCHVLRGARVALQATRRGPAGRFARATACDSILIAYTRMSRGPGHGGGEYPQCHAHHADLHKTPGYPRSPACAPSERHIPAYSAIITPSSSAG